jgi:hypothetical protein
MWNIYYLQGITTENSYLKLMNASFMYGMGIKIQVYIWRISRLAVRAGQLQTMGLKRAAWTCLNADDSQKGTWWKQW